jgi:hypothetical protein
LSTLGQNSRLINFINSSFWGEELDHLIKKFEKHIPEINYSADDEKNQQRYFGQLRNGIPDGYGTMTWKDGQIYKGTEL